MGLAATARFWMLPPAVRAARHTHCCGDRQRRQTEGKAAALRSHSASQQTKSTHSPTQDGGRDQTHIHKHLTTKDTKSTTTMPLLSPSAKKKQQKIGGVPLDLARAVLGAVFDTLDETRTGSLEVAELQRVGFKTATMVGSPSDAQVDREAFVRTIVSLLGRKNADDSAKLLPEAVALCGRVFRLRAAAAARDAADLGAGRGRGEGRRRAVCCPY